METEADTVPPVQPNVNSIPAKTYPFPLDLFQRTAISYIDKNESVLVAAHTSAGKTVTAEYAIALSLREKQRVIYTSPIKALSNQKYRDLQQEFSDVGLMTGDVTIDPNASCLVMTTEILRSMLYRGSEVMREVAWVVFDEVHYLRDSERGVVWEESIILLPHKVRFLFLSATIPNAQEFVNWVSRVHQQPCHVVYTDYRPTPLEHWIYCSGGNEVFPVVNKKGKFDEESFTRAMASFDASNKQQDADEMSLRKRPKTGGKPADLEKIMGLILARDYAPIICFSFSKKDCEKYALQISRTGITLTTDEDKEMIQKVFDNAIAGLSDEDRMLPAVQTLLPLLKNGIGIHHGGLLPILKEIVEILFGENLLKCLFATETFSMGINMPAKTVLFTSWEKFDGKDFRAIRSGEYIQMSGRAGRRGKDLRGIVILMVDKEIELEATKEMMSGKADPLTSSFHLGYNMVLNLLRIEDANPEYIVKNSLYVFQREAALPRLQSELDALTVQRGSDLPDEVVSYHRLQRQVEAQRIKLRMLSLDKIKPFLGAMGRLIKVDKFGWGLVISEEAGIVNCLLCCDLEKDEPCSNQNQMEFRVLPVSVKAIEALSSICLVLPQLELKSLASRTKAFHKLREVQLRFKQAIPVLTAKDLKMEGPSAEAMETLEELQAALLSHPFHTNPKRDGLLLQRSKQLEVDEKQLALSKEIKLTKTMPLKEELKRMKVVLRRLGHLDMNDVVQLKGRVACEISTCDELLVVELLFAGVFNDLEPAICAALISVLVFEEGGEGNKDEKPTIKPELALPFKRLEECARRVAEVKRDAEEEIDVEEYVSKFKGEFMEVVALWCRGCKFKQLADVTNVMEGSIVRTVRREVELLRQMVCACKVIGDSGLEAKFQKAIGLMQRDIMFAASLYL